MFILKDVATTSISGKADFRVQKTIRQSGTLRNDKPAGRHKNPKCLHTVKKEA